jgi:hypothetical protein
MLDFGGPSAYYFSHSALLIVLSWSLGVFLDYYYQASPNSIFAWFNPECSTWKPIGRKGSWFIAVFLVCMIFVNSPSWTNPVLRARKFIDTSLLNLSLFSDVQPISNASTALEYWQRYFAALPLLVNPPVVALTKLQRATGLGYVERALVEEDLSSGDNDFVIYIHPEFDLFWNDDRLQVYNDEALICWDRAFTIPAMVGLPLINGVRNVDGCEITPYFGMGDYNSNSWNLPLDDDQLCERAVSLGFRKVLVINNDGHHVLTCVGES